jgi:hypothetical protein
MGYIGGKIPARAFQPAQIADIVQHHNGSCAIPVGPDGGYGHRIVFDSHGADDQLVDKRSAVGAHPLKVIQQVGVGNHFNGRAAFPGAPSIFTALRKASK